jgi:hypothetical protein
MVLFGVHPVRSGPGFLCGAGVVFPFVRRCSVRGGFSVSGLRGRCWFRGWRCAFLIRGGGSSCGCFVGCGSSSLGSVSGVSAAFGASLQIPHTVYCGRAQPHDANFSGLAFAVERPLPSATPITRTQQSNANFGGRLSRATGRAHAHCGIEQPVRAPRLLRPGRTLRFPVAFAPGPRAQSTLRAEPWDQTTRLRGPCGRPAGRKSEGAGERENPRASQSYRLHRFSRGKSKHEWAD